MDRRPRLELPRKAYWEILRHCEAAKGLMTGGVLAGKYIDTCTAEITGVLGPPPDSVRLSDGFVRGVSGLGEFFRTKEWSEMHYIGDWLYKPSQTVEATALDLSILRDLSRVHEGGCYSPAMLIIGDPDKRTGRRPEKAFMSTHGSVPFEIDITRNGFYKE